MPTLHTFNQSPAKLQVWERMCAVLEPQDSVILLENGTYFVMHTSLNSFASANPDIRFYALEPDLYARGLNSVDIEPAQIVDYSGFVALSAEHDKIISWY